MLKTLDRSLIRLYKAVGRRSLERLLRAKLASIPAGARLRILNIGAGGELYDILKQIENAEIVQVDIDPARLPDVVADACDLHMFGEGEFDFVFELEVLEHIREPQRALAEARRVLKTDGELICSVPFMFPIHDEPHDYYRFTHYGLKYLLRDFRLVRIDARNDYINALLLLMVRTVVIGRKRQRIGSLGIALSAALLYPIWLPMSKLFTSQLATTGYLAVATK